MSLTPIVVALSALLLAPACRPRAPKGPVVLQSNTGAPTWTSVSLTVTGDEADDNKREGCMEEAQKAGIQLMPGAPIAGTLYFLDDNDYLEAQGVPNGRLVFTSMGSNAVCKLALAKLVNIDSLVTISKAEKDKCKPTGSVEGSDGALFHAGNYDAAMAEAQFAVRAGGGNLLVADHVRQEPATRRVVVNGRGFKCD